MGTDTWLDSHSQFMPSHTNRAVDPAEAWEPKQGAHLYHPPELPETSNPRTLASQGLGTPKAPTAQQPADGMFYDTKVKPVLCDH